MTKAVHSLKDIKQLLPKMEGWGADLDLSRRPGVPRESPSTVMTAYGKKLPAQEPRFTIHQSIEHRGLTPVFGESVAPRGLSGIIRGYAYRFSEGLPLHWMALMLADRVDVVEGLLDDLKNGILPRPFKEAGWKASLKYDRRRIMKRTAIVLGIGIIGAVAVGALFATAQRSNSPSDDIIV